VALFASGVRQGYALATFGLSAFVMAVIVIEFFKGTRARARIEGESWPIAFLHLVERNRRRWGGYIVHAGIVLIFAGIAAGLPNAIVNTLELQRQGSLSILAVIVIAGLVAGVTALVCFVERGQRRILVNYAKRQVGRKVYGGQSSHLPLKLNMSGVIPPIFASSIILFPATVAGWFGANENMRWLSNIASTLHPGEPVYVFLYSAAIVFFCFFYAALMFNPKETAENLKKSGAFVPGIRPGDQTARYIEKIMLRLTLIGSIYVTLVCLLPEFLIVWKKVPFYFGGTSLLIIVVVTMDFMAQVQAYAMSHQYESLLKKANFKGGGVFPTR